MKYFVFALLLLSSCSSERASDEHRWDKVSGRFRWPSGQVTLLAGLYYSPGSGDTDTGTFSTLDGRVAAEHDIGSWGAVFAQLGESVPFDESKVGGARVWISQWKPRKAGDPTTFVVTFPDSDQASFLVRSQDQSGLEMIRRIARSFRSRPLQ